MAQRHQLVVNLGTDAMAAEEGVYLEREVEGCASCRQGFDLALGREHENFARKEVELDGVEEVHGVGLRVIEDLLDGAQPVVKLALVVHDHVALLIFPVGSKSLFCHLVHVVRAYLHLYPLALFRH